MSKEKRVVPFFVFESLTPRSLEPFIRLLRRPQALPVDECISLGWIIHAPQY
jgi:hypothetical protein